MGEGEQAQAQPWELLREGTFDIPPAPGEGVYTCDPLPAAAAGPCSSGVLMETGSATAFRGQEPKGRVQA